MALPLATSPTDVRQISRFLARKPAGASIQDAKAVLGNALVDNRKLLACQMLGVLERDDGRLKLTGSTGRAIARADDAGFAGLLRDRLGSIQAYSACLEWLYEQEFSEVAVSDVGAFWHDHFPEDLGTELDREIALRGTCFLQLAEGAGLGTFVAGRRGQPSRLELDRDALAAFVHSREFDSGETIRTDDGGNGNGSSAAADIPEETIENHLSHASDESSASITTQERRVSSGIFIGHGKNRKPLAQLRGILDQFKIPYKVAVEEANLGRPISEKVRDTMQECNCAILVFTADEEYRDVDGNSVWRPSENVVHELGAAGFLYSNRIVILKEKSISFPTNFRDIGYIEFEKDELSAKAMDLIRELIGFGIVKVST